VNVCLELTAASTAIMNVWGSHKSYLLL